MDLDFYVRVRTCKKRVRTWKIAFTCKLTTLLYILFKRQTANLLTM